MAARPTKGSPVGRAIVPSAANNAASASYPLRDQFRMLDKYAIRTEFHVLLLSAWQISLLVISGRSGVSILSH